MNTDVKETEADTSSSYPDFQSSRRIIKSLKTKADKSRTLSEKFADTFTAMFGSMPFLTLNALWFIVWIVINLGFISFIEPFDPFPFGLLTMVVSLEAIMLATFVLISQNRSEKIDDLREEIDLHIDITTEKEVTKALELLRKLLEKNGVDTSGDQNLNNMLKDVSEVKIQKVLEKQMDSKV